MTTFFWSAGRSSAGKWISGAGLAGQEETLVAAFDAGKKLPDERIVSVSGRKCPEPVVEVGQVELFEEVQLTRSFTAGESLEKGQVAAQFAERVGGIEIVAGVREGLEDVPGPFYEF